MFITVASNYSFGELRIGKVLQFIEAVIASPNNYPGRALYSAAFFHNCKNDITVRNFLMQRLLDSFHEITNYFVFRSSKWSHRQFVHLLQPTLSIITFTFISALNIGINCSSPGYSRTLASHQLMLMAHFANLSLSPSQASTVCTSPSSPPQNLSHSEPLHGVAAAFRAHFTITSTNTLIIADRSNPTSDFVRKYLELAEN